MSYKSNIYKFYLFNIISALELTLSIFVLFLLANNLSMSQVMGLETLLIIIVLLLEIPSGAFADLFGRKTSLALAALSFSIAYIIYGFGSIFWIFVIAKIFTAIGKSLISGADSALIYDSLKAIEKQNQYAKIFGKAMFLQIFTYAAAALISGFLATYLTYRTLFFITAAIIFSGFLIALTFKEPPVHKKIHEKNYFKHILEAIKFSYNHKIVKNLIIYFGMFAALTHLTYFIIQPFYEQSTYPKYIIGIATFLFFTGGGLGVLFAEKFTKRIKEQKLLLAILLIASLCFITIFFVNKILALIFIAIMAFVSGIREIIVNKGINENTDSHHRATVISIQSISKSIMYAIFAPLIGLFTEIYTPKAAFLMMGIGLLLFFIYYFILSKINKKAL